MEKSWFKSKTVWGSIILAIEAGLKTLPGEWMYIESAILTIGTFLTLFGFRSALK